MNVQSNVRIPSPLLRSLTSRMTRKRRKKVMEMRELSSELWGWVGMLSPHLLPATSLSHALYPPPLPPNPSEPRPQGGQGAFLRKKGKGGRGGKKQRVPVVR